MDTGELLGIADEMLVRGKGVGNLAMDWYPFQGVVILPSRFMRWTPG